MLKLKQYRSELKLLKEQRQALRKSPERRIGQVLLAPCRIPEKLVKAAWNKLRPASAEGRRTPAPTDYQKWFQRHSVTREQVAALHGSGVGNARTARYQRSCIAEQVRPIPTDLGKSIRPCAHRDCGQVSHNQTTVGAPGNA